MPLNPLKLRLTDHDFMMDEISLRDLLNYDEDVDRSDNDDTSGGSADGSDNDDDNEIVADDDSDEE